MILRLSKAVVMAAVPVVAVSTLGLVGPASADTENGRSNEYLLGSEVISPGKPLHISGKEIAAIRKQAHPKGEPSAKQKQEMVEELVTAAQADGSYLDEQSVDVVPLLDGQMDVALPDDAVIEQATVEVSDKGDLTAGTVVTGDPAATAQMSGPSMATKWNLDGGPWEYKIYINLPNGTRVADGRFWAKRWTLAGDGQPNIVHYRYDRWGDAQVNKLGGGHPDPYLRTLRIQSFPYDSIEKHLRNWDAYKPASDLADSGCSSYTASFTFMGVGASRPFQKCGAYNMWRNIDKPSSYWLQFEGKTQQNREVGYTLAWAQDAGSAGSQHDEQQIVISFSSLSGIFGMLPNVNCKQTDAGRTCLSE